MGYVSSIYNCVPVGERPAKCVSCLNSFLVGQENVRKNIIVNRMKPAKCLPVFRCCHLLKLHFSWNIRIPVIVAILNELF